MGLIQAAKDAIKGSLHEQWKEVIRCENMSDDILMVKKLPETGVITNKSVIVVDPGQCAVIIDNGRVVDATAVDGVYTYDESSAPTFFAGQFGDVFKDMWKRFTYNGATPYEQAVYYFNLKEIVNNKFGTATPIPFQDWSHPIPNQMTNTLSPLRVEIKCFGKYTFKIYNPAAFMQEVAGTATIYHKEDITEQIKSEVIAAFQNVANELGSSENKVPVLEMPSQTDEIKDIMDKGVFDEAVRTRGLAITGFVVESVTLTDESEKKIDDYELSSNATMQQGRLVDAYANAVEKAASNAGGAANGFVGIGMMNMASGGMMGGIAQTPWQDNSPKAMQDTWTCDCGQVNTSKFCSECGKPKEKICSKCGKKLSQQAKFCDECGEKV